MAEETSQRQRMVHRFYDGFGWTLIEGLFIFAKRISLCRRLLFWVISLSKIFSMLSRYPCALLKSTNLMRGVPFPDSPST